jgi:hypothetical protein
MYHLHFTHHVSENKISKNCLLVTYNVNKREISCQEEESIHQLLFTDMSTRGKYAPATPYWNIMSRRGKYTPATVYWHVNKSEYATCTLLAYVNKRKVCTSQPLLTYHVENREVYTSYPSGKHAPPTLYWHIMLTRGNYATANFYWHIVSTRWKYAPPTLYWHTTWHKSFTCMYHGCKHREFKYIYKLSLTAINKCQCSHWYSNWWLDETITDCP